MNLGKQPQRSPSEWRGLYLKPMATFMQKNSMAGLRFLNVRFSMMNVRGRVAEASGGRTRSQRTNQGLNRARSAIWVRKNRELVL